MILCIMCGKEAVFDIPSRVSLFRKTGRAYCSRACAKKYRSKISSISMAKTNRLYASDRMKKNNPTKSIETRKKISEALKKIGHSPSLRGGNGKPSTKAEVMLYKLFSPIGFSLQTIVNTGGPHPPGGYPNHYKIDCGNKKLKIAIEADGGSHGPLKRQAQDEKKDNFLKSIGWSVFRFKNEDILESPSTIFELISKEVSIRGAS